MGVGGRGSGVGDYGMFGVLGPCHLGRRSSSSVITSSVTATLSSIAVGVEVAWDICTRSFSTAADATGT